MLSQDKLKMEFLFTNPIFLHYPVSHDQLYSALFRKVGGAIMEELRALLRAESNGYFNV